MSQKRIAMFKGDYHPKENGKCTITIKEATKLVVRDLGRCKMNKVRDGIEFISANWGLNPSRTEDFKIIKKILVRSVLYN